MTKKLSPLAKDIADGLQEAIAYAQGKPAMDTKETIVYTADAKAIREKLQLSQSEFATTYRIPLPTLQNWEQRRRTPDATASAYLWSIESYPQQIRDVQAKKNPHIGRIQ